LPETATKGSMYIDKKGNTVPVLYITVDAAAKLLKQPLTSFTDLKNIQAGSIDAKLSYKEEKATTYLESSNVVGILPGTDKKNEYVFVTGHYDHLGKKGNVIYYGADDDGSGTTSVMQIATAFAKAKADGYAPRRTMVFMTVSGEEEGLWGSEYYSEHPLFPMDKTSVDLNIDMVGRIDPDYKGDSLNYVYAIGESKLSSDLRMITDSLNTDPKLEIDRKFNDPKDPNRFYYRSDHFNFARKGVPVIFYFNGVHADYHQPGDTVDKINFPLMAKRVQFIFSTAWVMANRNDMLKRDMPLD
jgi:Zn-dependent M28 family amino/carboxypeptidase